MRGPFLCLQSQEGSISKSLSLSLWAVHLSYISFVLHLPFHLPPPLPHKQFCDYLYPQIIWHVRWGTLQRTSQCSCFNHVCKVPFAIFTGLEFRTRTSLWGYDSFHWLHFSGKLGKQVCSFRIQRDYREKKEAQNDHQAAILPCTISWMATWKSPK